MHKLIITSSLLFASTQALANIQLNLGNQQSEWAGSHYIDLKFEGNIFEGGLELHIKDEQLQSDLLGESVTYGKVGAGYTFAIADFDIRPYYNFGFGGSLDANENYVEHSEAGLSTYNAIGIRSSWKVLNIGFEARNHNLDLGSNLDGEGNIIDNSGHINDEKSYNLYMGFNF